MLQQGGHTAATLVDRLIQQLMYNPLNPSKSYQICTGGSSAILRGSSQPPPPPPENFGLVPRLGRGRFRPYLLTTHLS
jgi:hypothetical protein